MSIEKRVREIVCQHLDADSTQVEMNASFVEELGANSICLMELTLALEETFEIDIPGDDAERLSTVGDVVDYITAKIPNGE
jgi:acyl carrier protein